jgi:hypothetical protein
MLLIPHEFQQGLMEWIKIPLSRSVALSACRFYDEWVQVTYHGGQMVLGRSWREIVHRYNLLYKDNV